MLKFDLNILWTIINLLVFYLLIRLVLFKPIKRVLDKRQQLIDSELDDARRTNEQAQEKLADYEQRIADYQTEGRQIIDKAKDDARQEYDRIMDKAAADADEIRRDARKQMDAEMAKTRLAAKEDIARLAIQAAEKVVGASVNADTDSDIFDQFLNESSESDD